jgi:thiamine kinase-like enzyme
MADLHAHFWGFEDTVGLFPMGNRYFALTPLMSNIEAERGGTDPVPKLVGEGWKRIRDVAPGIAKILLPLLDNPFPLVEAQARGPQTLVHSDWKAGNLGAHEDGRTVLLDWAFPGEAPGSLDIAWYVAVNCDLLPQSKEDTIEAYREALQRNGVEVGAWWDEWMSLGLLGMAVLMTWSKSGDELAWWEEVVPRAVRYLS